MLPTNASHPHPEPQTLQPGLTPDDRSKLTLLFRTRGDAISFAALREEDPLDTLAWLDQPHIRPWHDAIRAAHREHEATETHLSLARALKDITRILDLEADSTLRIRAVNAIIKLANAIHRASLPAAGRAGVGLAKIAPPPIPSSPVTATTSIRMPRSSSNASGLSKWMCDPRWASRKRIV